MSRPLRIDDYVRTADGAEGRIIRLLVDDQAEIYFGDVTDTVTLPIGELTRVPDPRRRRPPIQGMPDARPRCAFCDRLLAPLLDEDHDGGPPWSRRVIRRTWRGWRSYQGLFHSLTCALRFAVAAHRAGYRIVRGKD